MARRIESHLLDGPAGKLEALLEPPEDHAPIEACVVCHPHPLYGGTMHNKVVHRIARGLRRRGSVVLRFNFRGVGRSQGYFDRGEGELADAAAALDWLQGYNTNASACWIGGFSFGAWIGMQLLMRRPEIAAFIAVAPPANLFDFSFLAPCPSSGLIIQGDQDQIVPLEAMQKLITKLQHQRDIKIDYRLIAGADHFFQNELEELGAAVEEYIGGAKPKRAASGR